MAEVDVPVYCYWNGCIKDGPNGIYYEGSTLRLITVIPKTEFNEFLDHLYQATGLDREAIKFDIIGRYPSVQQFLVKYIRLPVVNDISLETMLELPSKHPYMKIIDLYLEVKSASDGVTDSDACSFKRQRTDSNDVHVKLERETDRNSESDKVVHFVDLTGESSTSNKDSSSGVSKPCLSSLWLDDHDLRVGLCFKDGDDLKKAVDWCSLNGQQKCIIRETAKDECIFECIRWKCKWSLAAVTMERHGLVEIIKYIGPHTCRPIAPEDLSMYTV